MERDRRADEPFARRRAHALDEGARAPRSDARGANAMNDATKDAALGRVLEGYLRGLEAGRRPDRRELLEQHPELAELLAPALDGLDFVHGATSSLRGAPTATEISAGETLGDYRLTREIGRGGMAVVYEAEQVSLGRHVALKVLPFASVLDPKQRERFKNEALAAAQLRHPNI